MNTLLSNVDRVVSKLAPLNHMLETVAERVLPTTKARAYSCSGYCDTYCKNGGRILRQNFVDCLGSVCHYGCACDRWVSSC